MDTTMVKETTKIRGFRDDFMNFFGGDYTDDHIAAA